jgi:group II intron reverse transcriptase/maturase
MNGHGKSDNPIVPEKLSNKATYNVVAEMMEGSGLTKGSKPQRNTRQTQGWESVQSELCLVRRKAKEDKKVRFTALMHHIYNPDTLKAAFYALKRDAAAGVDRQTWEGYSEGTDENLRSLSDRLRRGAYRAKPVRRVFIPKPDGKQRPLAVTALEDKIVQRATVEVLNAIYETDFLGFSYGFRPRRSQHQALDALYAAILSRKVSWVLDADIRDYFGSINREWLVKFIEHRIADKRIIHLIQKWLRAGVLEDGKVEQTEHGLPQGASASPLLANVYLHYVYDLWVQWWRQKRARGDVIVVRFADDTIVGFQYKSDAEKFLEELRNRLLKFQLELHPEKTRLIMFGRFAARMRAEAGQGKPDSFQFLGFTHSCGKSKGGKFMVVRTTIKKRMRAKVSEIKQELRRRMHAPPKETGRWLKSVLVGHYRYYGVSCNFRAMEQFRYQIYCAWRRALARRSQVARVTWNDLNRLIDRWLPRPRLYHEHPITRFLRLHPR